MMNPRRVAYQSDPSQLQSHQAKLSALTDLKRRTNCEQVTDDFSAHFFGGGRKVQSCPGVGQWLLVKASVVSICQLLTTNHTRVYGQNFSHFPPDVRVNSHKGVRVVGPPVFLDPRPPTTKALGSLNPRPRATEIPLPLVTPWQTIHSQNHMKSKRIFAVARLFWCQWEKLVQKPQCGSGHVVSINFSRSPQIRIPVERSRQVGGDILTIFTWGKGARGASEIWCEMLLERFWNFYFMTWDCRRGSGIWKWQKGEKPFAPLVQNLVEANIYAEQSRAPALPPKIRCTPCTQQTSIPSNVQVLTQQLSVDAQIFRGRVWKEVWWSAETIRRSVCQLQQNNERTYEYSSRLLSMKQAWSDEDSAHDHMIIPTFHALVMPLQKCIQRLRSRDATIFLPAHVPLQGQLSQDLKLPRTCGGVLWLDLPHGSFQTNRKTCRQPLFTFRISLLLVKCTQLSIADSPPGFEAEWIWQLSTREKRLPVPGIPDFDRSSHWDISTHSELYLSVLMSSETLKTYSPLQTGTEVSQRKRKTWRKVLTKLIMRTTCSTDLCTSLAHELMTSARAPAGGSVGWLFAALFRQKLAVLYSWIGKKANAFDHTSDNI